VHASLLPAKAVAEALLCRVAAEFCSADVADGQMALRHADFGGAEALRALIRTHTAARAGAAHMRVQQVRAWGVSAWAGAWVHG
jgi:hypothetical protein